MVQYLLKVFWHEVDHAVFLVSLVEGPAPEGGGARHHHWVSLTLTSGPVRGGGPASLQVYAVVADPDGAGGGSAARLKAMVMKAAASKDIPIEWVDMSTPVCRMRNVANSGFWALEYADAISVSRLLNEATECLKTQ